MQGLILIGGVLYLVSRLMQKKEALNRLEYRPKRVQIPKVKAWDIITTQSLPVQIDLDIINQGPEALPFRNFVGRIMIGGTNIPFSAKSLGGVFPPYSVENLVLTSIVKAQGLLQIIRQALKGNIPKKARVIGTLNLGNNITLPIDTEFDLKIG